MQRYVGETERLLGILDTHLADKEYLVGNKYSIADIASFGWVNGAGLVFIDFDRFPNLKAWRERIAARPQVQAGLAVPFSSPFAADKVAQRLKDDKEFADKEKALREEVEAAKEKYGYKYSSP